MAEASYGSLQFAEQIEFFRRKLNLPTSGWTDVYASQHDWSFVVSGANRDAIVADFRTSIDKVIAEGGTLAEWRRDFDRIVATHGWDYKGGRNWRSRIIYETNLRNSFMAGRSQQLRATGLPYWQYRHSHLSQEPRRQHLAWDKLVLRADDPFWDTHMPMNAWGCKCDVRGLSERDLKQMGKTGPDRSPRIVYEDRIIGQRSVLGPRTVRVPEGIDPGFEYAPGVARLRGAIPPELPDPPHGGSTGGAGLPNLRPADALPPPRPFPAAELLPAGLPPEDYARDFLSRFGATLDTPAVVRDVIGERLVVGRELFTTPEGEWKATKRERGPLMPLLAQALLDPDEIWVRLEWLYSLSKAVVRRRYIARFAIEGQEQPALVVFELGTDGWSGVTTFAPTAPDYADSLRIGARLYRREE